MPFSVVAYSQSLDTSGILSEIDPIKDQHITSKGKSILVPDWAKNLIAVYGIGADLTQGQMSSPSMRQESLLDMLHLAKSVTPSLVQRFPDMLKSPRLLTKGEGLRALLAEDAVGASRMSMLCLLEGEREAIPDGVVEIIEATATDTLSAYDWTLVTMDLSQQLRAGRYAIVGFRAKSAGLIFVRLVIPGSAYRPGCVGVTDEDAEPQAVFETDGLGNWGEFEDTFLPQVEFFSSLADTAEKVWFEVVYLGE